METFFTVSLTILIILEIVRLIIHTAVIIMWRMDKKEEALKEELKYEFNRKNP